MPEEQQRVDAALALRKLQATSPGLLSQNLLCNHAALRRPSPTANAPTPCAKI